MSKLKLLDELFYYAGFAHDRCRSELGWAHCQCATAKDLRRLEKEVEVAKQPERAA